MPFSASAPSQDLLPKPSALIFDLDGTLWDTCPPCALAWNRALSDCGIPYREIAADEIRAIAGLPHGQCIRTVFHDLGPEDHLRLEAHTAQGDIDAIREFGGELYPGVRDGLGRLARHYPLYIVSNCQAGYIELFFELTGLGPLFGDIECWGNTAQPKAANIQALIARGGLSNPVYIGDTRGDAEAAAACGIPFLHAGWGFGSLSEVRAFADFAQLTQNLVPG